MASKKFLANGVDAKNLGIDSSTGVLHLQTNGSTKFVIDATGNLGTGSSLPLDLVGTNLRINNGFFGSLAGPSNHVYLAANARPTTSGDVGFTTWKYLNPSPAARFDSRDGEFRWFTAPAGTADAAVSWSYQMQLTNSGDLGIGTTPSAKLHVSTTTADMLKMTGRNFYDHTFSNEITSDGVVGARLAITSGSNSGELSYTNSSGERLRIDKDGNVGITTTTPYERLHVKAANSDVSVRLENTAASTKIWNITAGGGGNYIPGSFAIRNVTDEITPIFINPNGDVGVGTTSPTARLHVRSRTGEAATGYFVSNVSSWLGVGTELPGGTAGLYLNGLNTNGVSVASGRIFAEPDVVTSGANSRLTFHTRNSSAVISERMRLDSFGNLGVGAIPPAWRTSDKAIDFGPSGAVVSTSGLDTYLSSNLYINSSAQWAYKNNGTGSVIGLSASGRIIMYSAPTGTAGNTATLQELANWGTDGFTGGQFSTFNIAANTNYSPISIAGDKALQSVGGVGVPVLINSHDSASIRLAASGIQFSVGPSIERMRLDANGNLGVGTTAPDARLDIGGGADTLPNTTMAILARGQDVNFRLVSKNGIGSNNSGDATFHFGQTYGASPLAAGLTFVRGGSSANGYLKFISNSTEQMTLASNGYLGIGTSTPTSSITVAGTSPRVLIQPGTGVNSALVQFNNTAGNAYVGVDSSSGSLGGAAYGLSLWHSGAYPVVVGTNNLERMRIDSSGSVVIGRTAPVSTEKFNVTTNAPGSVPIAIRVMNEGTTTGTGSSINFTTNTYSGAPINLASISSVAFDSVGSGTLVFNVANGGTAVEKMRLSNAGNLTLAVDGSGLTWGDGSVGLFGNSSTETFTLYTNATERFRVDSAGNVMVGMTTSLYDTANRRVLNVNGATTSLISVSSGGSGATSGYLYWDGSNLSVCNDSTSGSLIFGTSGGTTRMRITSAGVIQDAAGNELGYKDIPPVTNSFERGKANIPSGNTTVNTGSAAGSTYHVYNNSAASITLVQGSGLTMRLGGTTTTGSRTLLPRGFATIWYVSTTECIVNGNVT